MKFPPPHSFAERSHTVWTVSAAVFSWVVGAVVALPAFAAPLEGSRLPPPPLTSPLASAAFEHVSFDEGLAPDLVFCIHEDSSGFLWFGTMHGLVRFDGHEYLTMRHDPFDSTSISCDDVVCIAEDARGDLWIGTYGAGLNRYDRAAGRFDRLLPDGGYSTSVSDGIIWDVTVAANGVIWAATGAGLDCVDPLTMRVTHRRHDPADAGSLGPGLPRSVLVRRSGALWVGLQGGGVDSLDASTGRFVHFRADSAKAGAIAGDQVAALLEDREGTLWVGTVDGGLCVRSAGADGFVHPGVANGWSVDLPAGGVQTLHQDADGILWVGTTVGLVRLDPRTREVSHAAYDSARKEGLSGANIPAICRDVSGVLWVSCYSQGLDRLLPGGRRFERFGDDASEARRHILSFAEDRDGTLWVGTHGGLSRVVGGVSQFFDGDRMQQAAPPGGSVRALAVDREGVLWVGAAGGLSRWNPERNKFETWRALEGEPLTSRVVTALLVDHEGALWVGSDMGLNRLDLATRRNLHFIHDPRDTTTLADPFVLSLFEDSSSRIWVGSYRGVSRIEADRRTITHLRRDQNRPETLGNNYVYEMHQAANGVIWLATAGGLDRYEESTGDFVHLRERDGLPNAVVSSIVEDSSGMFWLGTQRGLARFDPKTSRFSSYDKTDGLPSNLFSPGAALRRADGSLLMGGPAGWAAFQPANLADSDWAAPVVVADIEIPGRAASPWRDASRDTILRLAPNERAFTIELAALDFRNPRSQRYAYKLEGVDREWIEAGTRRAASYSSVPPGRYEFRAKAAGADGVWSEPTTLLEVMARPPFWRTIPFLAVASLLLAAGAFVAQRLHVRSLVRRALDLERARAEERDAVRRRAAADFHDELGHRLARIGLFSELAARRAGAASAPEDVQAALARIGDEARRLAGDARDFLWALGTQSGSLGDLASRLARFGEHLFERTEIEFSVEGQSESLDSLRLEAEDRRNLLSIFKEAMTNSLRHSQCRTVQLRFGLDGEDFSVVLEDDGCGLTRATTATGQGLRNMEWRAGKLEGVIEILPRPGGGTIVALKRRAAGK